MQPEKIGRYRIVEELGRGGFATVYLGEDRGLNDLVAIKILADNHAIDPESVARFVAEARVMRNLRAPGVVTVHDVGEQDGRPYFVMEYCERGTISERLTRLGRRLTVEEGVGLAQAISRAMAGMHGATPPVVHRDIKPDNLLIRHSPNVVQPTVGELLGPDEELIVGDFGLAKVVDINSTKMSLIAYTRGFAPPEQIRGDGSIQPSADVFSASAVVAAAISGELPEQVFAAGDQAFSDGALTTTGPLRRELERGLTFERTHRHTDVHEWSEALVTSRSASPSGYAAGQVSPPTQPVDSPPPINSYPAVQAPQPPSFPTPAGSSFAAPPVGVPPISNESIGTPPLPLPRTVKSPAPVSLNSDQTVLGSPIADGQSGSTRGRGYMLLAGLVLLAVVGIGLATVLLRGGGAPTITGPSEGNIGDELAFAVLDADVQEWAIGGSTSSDPILKLMPTSLGDVSVRVVTDEGEAEMTVTVREASSELRIEGPGHIPIGAVTTLTAEGANGEQLSWKVNGQTFDLASLEVQPNQAGVLEVELTTANGQRTTREFVVAPNG